MALIHCDLFSEALGLNVPFCAIVPQVSTMGQIGMGGSGSARVREGGYPTLWLLHGLSDDQTIWIRRTSIERYVAPRGIAVVMPAVGRSFYADMHHGPRYWTYLSEELPAIARHLLPLSDRREDNFVAGLSMGGYGAFKLALARPDRYALGASLSGALDPAATFGGQRGPAWDHEMTGVFGDLATFAGSDNDLFHLADRLARHNGPRPQLYACCGTKDSLIEHNRSFRDHAAGLGLDLAYEEDAGHGHTWDYWDLTIQRVLQRLAPLRSA